MYDFISITLPTSEIKTLFSYRTEHTMSRYSHEHLSMYLEHWSVDYSQIKAGSPVRAEFKSEYGKNEFVGYIHKVNVDISPGKHFIEVIALGATVTMKQASQKVWKQVTADQVFTEICKKHNFSYHATPHGRVYDHIMQAGLTDWEFIKKLALEIGHTLRAEGTSLFFDPIGKDFSDKKQNAPYFVMRAANDPDGFNLYSFTPIIGESIEHDNTMKAATAVAGVDLKNNNSVVQTNQNRPTTTRKNAQTEFVDRFSADQVIPNSNAAKYQALAHDAKAQYPYRGEAVVMGDARLKPDMPVYVDGLGSDYSGFWTVLEVKHVVKQSMFTTELVLGTDSLGRAAQGLEKPAATPVRIINATKPATTKPTKATLVKNNAPKNNNATSNGFGKTYNRTQPKITVTTKGSSAKWVGTGGNLRTVPVKNNASPAAVAKLRSTGVR